MGFFDRFQAPAFGTASAADGSTGIIGDATTRAGQTPGAIDAFAGSRTQPVNPTTMPVRHTTGTTLPGANDSGLSGGQSGGNVNIQQEVQRFLQGKPPGAATLQALKQHMATLGVNIDIPTHGGGQLSDDKIVLPDRSVIDLYGDVGGANTSTWAQDGYWVNGQPSSRPDVVAQDPNDFGAQGFSQTGVNGYASFDAPGINKPFTEQFSFNPQDIANSEVYQFARDEGLNAVNRGHAAQGTFNTGGALKDLMKYASGNASQAYGDEFNRRRAVWGDKRDTYMANANNTFGRLNQLAEYGAGAAGKYADSVSSIYGQQGNVNATRAGNPPWWANGVNTGIAAGADALFNRK